MAQRHVEAIKVLVLLINKVATRQEEHNIYDWSTFCDIMLNFF